MHILRHSWNRPLRIRLAAKLSASARVNPTTIGSNHGPVSVERPEYADGAAVAACRKKGAMNARRFASTRRPASIRIDRQPESDRAQSL